MPRINTIQSQNRLQVTSPVPIGATGGARLEGENVSDIGDRMAKAGVAYAGFAQEVKDTDRKVNLELGLEKHKQAAMLARYNTNNYVDGEGKPLSGEEKLKKFDEYYNQASKDIFNEFKGQDEDFKKQLYIEGFKVRNSIADNVLQDAMQADVRTIEAKRTEALGTRISNVTANPLSAPQAIAENNKTWQDLKMLGPPDARLKKQNEEAKNISLAAINSLLANEEMGATRFEDARQMLSKDLAPYLGDDTIKFNEVITNEEHKYKDRVAKGAHEAEKKQKEAEKELQEDNATKFFVEASSSSLPKKQEEIRNKMLAAVANGTLTMEAFKGITSQGRATLSYNSDRAKTNYVYQIVNKRDLGKISERIMTDPSLDPGDKQALLKMANTARASKKNTDPLFQKDYKTGERMILKHNGGIENTIGEIIVPGAKAKIANQMMFEYTDNIRKGLKPKDAAEKVLNNQYDEITNTKLVPQKYLSITKQGNSKVMKESEPDMQRIYNDLKSSGKKEEALEVLKIYKDRMEALQRKEERQGGKN